MARYFFLLLLILVVSFSSTTKITGQETSYNYTNKNLPCIDKIFTVYVHVMKDSLGKAGIDSATVAGVIDGINKYFSPICVSFKACEYVEYPYYQFDTLTNTQFAQMERHFHKDFRINLYLVSHQSVELKKCGFASLKGITNMFSSFIVMEKGCISPNTLAHEMGHYFGLSHTFAGGTELVDGSNCLTAGDKICDTPADPFVDGDPLGIYVNSSCTFTGLMKDANGDYYQPDVGNIMSYYNCYCGFTSDQFRLMASNYNTAVKKMW